MKRFFISLYLMASVIVLNAQNYTTYRSQSSSNTNTQTTNNDFNTQMGIQEAFEKFYNKELSYSDAPQKYLIRYFDVLNQSQFSSSINRVTGVPGFGHNGPDIEVEDNGNIYTYPIAFTNAGYLDRYRTQMYHSYDNPDIITFYSTKMSPEEARASYVNVHGAHYPAVQVGMNKIKIGDKIANLSDVLKDIVKENALPVITPSQYLRLGSDKILISLDATYAGTPSIVFTKPRYEVIGGQLMEIDNGVHYEVPMQDVSYLTVLNINTMSSTPIALKGLYYIGIKQVKDTPYIIAYNASTYGENGRGRHRQTTISQNGSPIYLLENTQSGVRVKASFIPKEGDVITDIQLSECGKYYYLCGTNKNQGYVGYDNPILTIIKSSTLEEVARYRGKRKDRYYAEVLCIDKENIYIRYDDWNETGFNDGRGPGHFEVINIPSIVTPAN